MSTEHPAIMRSVIGHPILDFFRALESRTRSGWVRSRMQNITNLALTQEHNGILLFLSEQGTMTVTQLADVTGVSIASASRYVANLESWGLVQKTRSVDDARAIAVVITPAGHEVRTIWTTWWAEMYRDVLSRFAPDDARSLSSDLRRLQSGLMAEPDFSTVPAIGVPPNASEFDHVTSIIRWMSIAVRHPSYTSRLLPEMQAPPHAQHLLVLRAVGLSAGTEAKALSAVTNLDRSAVSRTLTALERGGFVLREPPVRTDLRSIQVTPTHAGRALLISMEARELAPIVRTMQSWSSSDINRCLSNIEELVAGLAERA